QDPRPRRGEVGGASGCRRRGPGRDRGRRARRAVRRDPDRSAGYVGPAAGGAAGAGGAHLHRPARSHEPRLSAERRRGVADGPRAVRGGRRRARPSADEEVTVVQLNWRPQIEWDGHLFRLSLPCRPWVPISRGVGGSERSAAGVPAAYEIRRDRILRVTLRVYEDEWEQVEQWLEWA